MTNIDVLVIGGGVGGCAAALAAAKLGKRVVMTEETAWIGGQLTSQAVPPDENPWIEYGGSTRSYREFRNRVRNYYRRNYPLTHAARANERLNPGNGDVSRLCHEPRVAVAVLYEMLAPYISSGQVQILLHHKACAADTEGDKVRAVEVINLITGTKKVLEAPYVLDATELGDLLPLAGAEYVVGAESRQETGEPHALDGPADPMSQQALTYCFAVDLNPCQDNTIPKPEHYDFWRSYHPEFWPAPLLSWTASHPITGKPYPLALFKGKDDSYPLFKYRQILDKDNFVPGSFASSISLVNWPQVDYWLGPIIDVSPEEAQEHLCQAKQLSLSFLYWMQTEAPRHDGGYGYPELRLRPDVVGTEDGLAMYPYIRESRRIKAEFTVLEQHVSHAVRGERGAERFPDSVGIGAYRIDLHPSTTGVNYIDIGSWPFQIPLGSLIHVRMENLLPACKNLGVTHITNGCYRLHPVEWNIGEASGFLAAYCLEKDIPPRAVWENEGELKQFQALLVSHGVELEWQQIRAL